MKYAGKPKTEVRGIGRRVSAEAGAAQRRVATISVMLLVGTSAHAAVLTFSSGLPLNNQSPQNLVQNGSFEDHPDGGVTAQFWATGTSMPTATPANWTASGGSANYAQWKATDGFGAPVQPDGNAGLYFGNGFVASIDHTPTFNANGRVTFSGTPTIGAGSIYGQPTTLSQTVNLTLGHTYDLSFWAAGEDSAGGNFNHTGEFSHDGIFGLDVSGYDREYLTTPSGLSTLGDWHEYRFRFKATNASSTITFTNWGHFEPGTTTGWLNPLTQTTELVLDNVIINEIVPEPSTVACLALGASVMLLRRSRHRHNVFTISSIG